MYYWHQTCSFTTSFTLCPSNCSNKTLYATSFSCATNTTNARWSFFQHMTGSWTHLADLSWGGIQGLLHGGIELEPSLHYEALAFSVHPELRITSSFLATRSGFGSIDCGQLLELLNSRRPYWFDGREPSNELHPRNVNSHLDRGAPLWERNFTLRRNVSTKWINR